MTTCAKATMRAEPSMEVIVCFSSLTYAWSSRTRSLNHPFIRPSTILSRAASGLPFVARDLEHGGAFGVDVGLRHLVTAEVGRLGERDVHGDVVGQLLGAALDHHGNGIDAAARLLVQVGLDHLASFGHQPAHLPDRDVLLERGAQALDLVVELADGVLALGRDHGSQLVGQRHELVRLGHEIGLAAHFDHGRRVARAHGGHGALGGLPVGSLGRAGQALEPQDLCCLLQVAVGLLERVPAVEHAGAGHLAQGGNVLGGVLRHGSGNLYGLGGSGAGCGGAERRSRSGAGAEAACSGGTGGPGGAGVRASRPRRTGPPARPGAGARR